MSLQADFPRLKRGKISNYISNHSTDDNNSFHLNAVFLLEGGMHEGRNTLCARYVFYYP